MNIFWQVANQRYELHRYPKGQHDKSLQAWDGADEHLVEYILTLPEPPKRSIIFNDSFGAINIGLHSLAKVTVSDSYISQKSLRQNLELNKLLSDFDDNSQQLDSLATLTPASHVLIKLTKNIGYLTYQLEQIKKLSAPCQIVATGKTTQVTSSVLKLFEKYFTNVHTSLAKKKSRLIFAEHSAEHNTELSDEKEKGTTKQTKASKYPVTVFWPEKNIQLTSHANVFSKEQVDIGGRFLAEHLPVFKPEQQIIDLGCGNGLLGLACLKQTIKENIKVNIKFVDESYMAVKSAEHNVELNFPERLTHCEFIQDDCLTEQKSNSADIILCNPPFHQQNAITTHIAHQMFADAHRVLNPSGVFIVVANRHLPYAKQLKKHFMHFKVDQQNKKFIIYACKKHVT